jgi:hypothetical protein
MLISELAEAIKATFNIDKQLELCKMILENATNIGSLVKTMKPSEQKEVLKGLLRDDTDF